MRLLRDPLDNYRPMEKYFVTLTSGFSFGASALDTSKESKPKFYTPIALTDCVLLHMSRAQFLEIVEN